MKVSCVISEFNPFHNGHKYLIEKQRENGSTHIVAVMSGNFVQRGECAIFDKFGRAKCALMNGVDLVVELPTIWACSAAPIFARAGISIIESMGIIDSLFFGSECGDIELITSCASTILSDEFSSVIGKYKSGRPYASAVQSAVLEIAGKKCAGVLSSPNNILAVEYVKEIISRNVSICVETICRHGALHDSGGSCGEFSSASYIRENIDSPAVFSLLPVNTHKIVKDILISGNVADVRTLEIAILHGLVTMSTNEIAKLPDVGEGLENRIKQAVLSSSSLEEIIEKVVCKKYSLPRIKRILATLILGIDKDMQSTDPPYIRVLGLNLRGRELLKLMKKKASVPIVTKAAQYRRLLDDVGSAIFEKDIIAADIRRLACRNRSYFGQELQTGPCIIDD